MTVRSLLFLFWVASCPLLAQTGADTAAVVVRHSDCTATLDRVHLQAMHLHEAVVVSRDGERHTYRGPLLRTVLHAACPGIKELDKHAMTASAVKVTATDGFVAIIAGMEMDSTFKAQPVILATERDGSPLDGHYGPFQLIVPEDLRHARNVRNVRLVELLKP